MGSNTKISVISFFSYCQKASGFELLQMAEKAISQENFHVVGLIAEELGSRVRSCPAFCEPLLVLLRPIRSAYPETALGAALYILEVRRFGSIADRAADLWVETLRSLRKTKKAKELKEFLRHYHDAYKALRPNHPKLGRIHNEFDRLWRPKTDDLLAENLVQIWLEDCGSISKLVPTLASKELTIYSDTASSVYGIAPEKAEEISRGMQKQLRKLGYGS